MLSGVGAAATTASIERGRVSAAPLQPGTMPVMDPHTVLGLDAEASLEEASEAYRRLAKQWHPDRAGELATARMVELNVALELLRSAQRPRAGAPVAPARGHGHGV